MEEILDVKSNHEIQLNERSKAFLLEIAKWSKFLSIVGFVGIGLMALGGIVLLLLAVMNPYSRAVDGGPIVGMTLLYLILAVIYFFPVYYLFKSSVGLKNGINAMNEDDLTSGFENLKSHYKFLGIFMIVILSLYALFFIVAVLGGAMVRGL